MPILILNVYKIKHISKKVVEIKTKVDIILTKLKKYFNIILV